MGGLSSALAPIVQIGSALGSVASVAQPFYQDSVDRKRQKESDALSLQQAQANAAIQKEQNRLSALKDETERRVALKKAVAKQRANFGSQGIGSAGGSSEAVLLGLFNESDEERQLREQMTALRDNAISLNSAQIQQKNLLEQAQASQQDAINRITDLF